MSRNIGSTDCCATEGATSVVVTGNRYCLPADHFSAPGMLVADAQCAVCNARYTAWIGDAPSGYRADRYLVETVGFYDLSYRSTFNDEPGSSDFGAPSDLLPAPSWGAVHRTHDREPVVGHRRWG